MFRSHGDLKLKWNGKEGRRGVMRSGEGRRGVMSAEVRKVVMRNGEKW